jgi:poly(3-hydroxybutyrate) depolymerase
VTKFIRKAQRIRMARNIMRPFLVNENPRVRLIPNNVIMTSQVGDNPTSRNFQEEVIQQSNGEHWYRQSAETWFLVGGLVLFNVGCLVNPGMPDHLFQLLDFRFWHWWYFVVLLLITALSIKWFAPFRSRDNSCVGRRSHCRYILYVFWITIAMLVVLRVVFDTTTYFSGSTLTVRTHQPDTYEYLLHLPPGYTDFGKPKPLIVYLHGAGETNKGLECLKKHDLCYYAKGHITAKNFPFIVVSPATPKHGWEPVQVKRLIEQVVHDLSKRYRIDPSRIYLTGFSMGGFGTFHTASTYPEIFAAIVPVAGGGDPKQAENLRNVPIWAFHGDKDDVVPYERSAEMIDAVKESGHNDARLITLHGAGHGIVEEVYRNPELYRWMLTRRKLQ